MNPKKTERKDGRRVITVTKETYDAVNRVKTKLNRITRNAPKWTLSDVIKQSTDITENVLIENAKARKAK